ncbi:MAG TPA: phosphotransferase, partial [Bacillales bacterium]|nr:phosphotransferase [Bacillales bacterium]
MKRHAHNAFSDQILTEFASRYGAAVKSLKNLGGFENFVYEFENGGKFYILRITHGSHRSPDQIYSEVHWIRFLSDQGVSVSRPILSVNGKLVEEYGSGESDFSAVLFEKAAGNLAGENEWKEPLFRKMGRMTGKMHSLTKRYEPDSGKKRLDWLETMDDALKVCGDGTGQKLRSLREHFLQLPQGKDEYGLIHDDFHRGNFFINDGDITLFDFDDCKYS